MTEHESLIITSDDFFNRFNSKYKFTPVMEETLIALMLLYVLNGTSKFTNIVADLVNLLDRSIESIGPTLNSLAKLDLISYYREGRYRTIRLHIENEFLESLLYRFFGSNISSDKTIYDSHIMQVLNTIPIRNASKAIAIVQERTKKVDKKILEYQDWLAWENELQKTEQWLKIPNMFSREDSDYNPYFQFIERINSAIKTHISQSVNFSFSDLNKIISNIISENQKLPPWFYGFVNHNYNPIKLDEEEMQIVFGKK